MSDQDFKYLENKEVYEFLEGSGKNNLVYYEDYSYGLPYLSGGDLYSYCNQFGLVDELPGATRWTYVEALIKDAVANDRCDELLNFFFDLVHFNNLQGSSGLGVPSIPDEDLETVHQQIINAAVGHINTLIRLTRHELHYADGHFYMTESGKKPVIITQQLDKFSSDYVAGLRNRCKEHLDKGDYDTVITQSRTMIEETLIHIVEEAKRNGLTTEEPNNTGDLIKLYNQVKTIKNMHQSASNDKRINELLGGLERIVNSVAAMRNNASDAHGVGQRRINVNAREARLVMNCSMAFCEYMVAGKND